MLSRRQAALRSSIQMTGCRPHRLVQPVLRERVADDDSLADGGVRADGKVALTRFHADGANR